MNPPGVVKIHIMLHPEAELRQADIFFDFDVLIFQRPPVNSHSKKSLFLLTMGLAPMKLNLWGMAES